MFADTDVHRPKKGANPMIDLYSWNTSNGRKVAIMLEELDLPYQPVD